MFKWTYILYTVYYCQTINNMYSKKLYSNVNLCIFIVDKVKTQKKTKKKTIHTKDKKYVSYNTIYR